MYKFPDRPTLFCRFAKIPWRNNVGVILSPFEFHSLLHGTERPHFPLACCIWRRCDILERIKDDGTDKYPETGKECNMGSTMCLLLFVFQFLFRRFQIKSQFLFEKRRWIFAILWSGSFGDVQGRAVSSCNFRVCWHGLEYMQIKPRWTLPYCDQLKQKNFSLGGARY